MGFLCIHYCRQHPHAKILSVHHDAHGGVDGHDVTHDTPPLDVPIGHVDIEPDDPIRKKETTTHYIARLETAYGHLFT